jgi:cation:H+ antiporter
MILIIFLIILGLAILIFGADLLVRGASSISVKLGIAPLVVGLTVVAFGTSAPELVINLFGAFKGTTDLALGNIVGSNISNILLILGISALFTELKVQKSTTWKEIPFALLASIVLFFVAGDLILDNTTGIISRGEGFVLLGFFAIFLVYSFELFNKKEGEVENEEIKIYSLTKSLFFVFVGILGLFFGGQLFVNNAILFSKILGMSEALIGLTVVAIGTSLPELATSIVAALKKQSDIAIGNIVGSNIFNVFWILGLTSIIKPLVVNKVILQDILISVVATLLLFFFMFIGKKNILQKKQGVFFLLCYLVYMVFIVMRG